MSSNVYPVARINGDPYAPPTRATHNLPDADYAAQLADAGRRAVSVAGEEMARELDQQADRVIEAGAAIAKVIRELAEDFRAHTKSVSTHVDDFMSRTSGMRDGLKRLRAEHFTDKQNTRQ